MKRSSKWYALSFLTAILASSCSDGVQIGTRATNAVSPTGAAGFPSSLGGAGAGGTNGGALGIGGSLGIAGVAGSTAGRSGASGATIGMGGAASAGMAGATSAGQGGASAAGSGGGDAGAAGSAGSVLDTTCPASTPLAPLAWARIDGTTSEAFGYAADDAGGFYEVVISPAATDPILTACADVTMNPATGEAALVARFDATGACLWRRWLGATEAVNPSDSYDLTRSIAWSSGVVAVALSQTVVGVHDDGTLAWNMDSTMAAPNLYATGSAFVLSRTLSSVDEESSPFGPIEFQWLSPDGALGTDASFPFATTPGIAWVAGLGRRDGSFFLYGETDVAIPTLNVPNPPPTYDSLFAAVIGDDGAVLDSRVLDNVSNLGGTVPEVAPAVETPDGTITLFVNPSLEDSPTVMWTRPPSGGWAQALLGDSWISTPVSLPDGTIVVSTPGNPLTNQTLIGPLTGCAWTEPIQAILYPQAVISVGDKILVHGGAANVGAKPPCDGPTSLTIGDMSFSSPCQFNFAALIAP